MSSVNIHPTAIVHARAEVGSGSSIGAYSIIGPNVRLGRGNKIGPHVVIEGFTRLGDENQVYQFASIGSAPQDLKYRGEKSYVIIGNRNVMREYVTIQPGTVAAEAAKGQHPGTQSGDAGRSIVGNSNLFMVGSHVAHDARIGDNCVFANYASLAGHVEVGDRVTLGGFVGVHQFVRIGGLSILAAGSMVAQDIPPFSMAQGDRAALIGLNLVGLKRFGMKTEDIASLKRVFRLLFSRRPDSSGSSIKLSERIENAYIAAGGSEFAVQLIEFVKSSGSRGVASLRRSADADGVDRSQG